MNLESFKYAKPMERLDFFRDMKPDERLKYAQENTEWMELLSEAELDTVGRLLCHASPERSRKASPIIGDLTPGQAARLQAEFEAGVFGDENGVAPLRGDMPRE